MKRPAAGLALLLVLAGASAAPEAGVFRDITKASGIRMRVSGDLRRLKLIPTMIGGCAFGDYDGDGRPDLYVTNSVARWGKPNGHNCGRLFQNLGGGRFADLTEKAGIRVCGLGMGAFWVDLDGDGKLDLYLTNVGPNVVYWNRGDGTFEEGKDTGLEDPLFSSGVGFLDYDGDGRVDVVVANYLDTTPEWEAGQPQSEFRVPEDYVGQPSHLFHNEGGRKWRDVTRPAGLAIDQRETKTLGVAVLDYDGDGRPDLYFVNDRVGNRLFENVIGSRKSWIRIEPRVSADQRIVLGTTVRVTAGGRTQTKTFWVSPSYVSGSLTDLHFGLGGAAAADRIEVVWARRRHADVPKHCRSARLHDRAERAARCASWSAVLPLEAALRRREK